MQVAFGPPMPLLAGGRSPSLYTAAVCNECQAAFRDAQAAGLERFRQSLVDAQVCSQDVKARASLTTTRLPFSSLWSHVHYRSCPRASSVISWMRWNG